MATPRQSATPRRKAVARRVFDVDTAARKRIGVKASYDNARFTNENEKLWQFVDSLSAAAANTPRVRQIVRNRARYETANNSYAAGIVETLANDTVGPVVQLQLGDSERAQAVERDFERWAASVGLWQKVRTMRRAKAVDGEAFAQMFTNPLVPGPVKLDLRVVECDQIESWYSNVTREDEIDGIRFDQYGNPAMYRMLKFHPGDHRGLSQLAGDWIPSKFMLHYFRPTRPGQVRGISEILPALGLFGQLRRYTAAVIEAAQRAAEISAIMQTDLLPDQIAAELADPVTTIDIERNTIMSLPEGWKLAQLKAEQPTTTYAMFKAEILNEIARPVNMPYNVAACNSSGYNYASGRLDHQTYDRSIDVERGDLRMAVLDRILAAYMDEYAARKGMTADDLAEFADHEWYFAGRGHVDPNKEANADNVRFVNGSLTMAAYYAKQGKDWKRESAQFIRERIAEELEWNKAREIAGLPPAPYPRGIRRYNRIPAATEPEQPEEGEEQ